MKKTVWMMTAAVALFAGDISGDYLVTTVESNGKSEASYMNMSFSKEGKLMIMGMPAGSWRYDEAHNKVFITSVFDGKQAEENKIVKHDDKELVLQSKTGKMYYMKLDKKKIEKNNKTAPFLGTWNVAPNANEASQFTFTLPDTFSYEKNDKVENSTESIKGTWIYDPENKRVIVVAMGSPFRGENKITKTDGNTIFFDNGGKTLKAVKK